MGRLLALVLAVLTCTVCSACGGTTVSSPSASRKPAVLTAAPRPGVDYVAIVGDSFTGGLDGGGYDQAAWPFLTYTRLKEQRVFMDAQVAATPSSGWVEAEGNQSRSFERSLYTAAGANDAIVVLFGARVLNMDRPAEELAATVQSTLRTAHEKASKARLLVIGPVWTAWQVQDPTPEVTVARDVIRAESAIAGAIFLDPIAEMWFADRPEVIAGDGDPTVEGHAYIADRVLPMMFDLLTANPSR